MRKLHIHIHTQGRRSMGLRKRMMMRKMRKRRAMREAFKRGMRGHGHPRHKFQRDGAEQGGRWEGRGTGRHPRRHGHPHMRPNIPQGERWVGKPREDEWI